MFNSQSASKLKTLKWNRSRRRQRRLAKANSSKFDVFWRRNYDVKIRASDTNASTVKTSTGKNMPTSKSYFHESHEFDWGEGDLFSPLLPFKIKNSKATTHITELYNNSINIIVLIMGCEAECLVVWQCQQINHFSLFYKINPVWYSIKSSLTKHSSFKGRLNFSSNNHSVTVWPYNGVTK